MKILTGKIEYTFTVSDKNDWDIKFGSEDLKEADIMHNDLAALIIAQQVMENCAIKFREDKKTATGKMKQIQSQRLNKAIDGRFGVRVICDYLLDCYPDYIKYLKKQEVKNENNKGK